MSLLNTCVQVSPGELFATAGGSEGLPGATGATGATGAQGEKGEKGDIGLPGTAFVFYGTWVPGTNYAKNALAVSPADRNTYVALRTVINSVIDPSLDNTNWLLYTLGGVPGAPGATGAQGIPGSGANAQFWANFQAVKNVDMGNFDITKPNGKLNITSPIGVSIDGGSDLISLNAGNIRLTQNNAQDSLYLGAQTAVNIVGGAGVAVSAGASVSIQSALATLINGIGGVAITAGGAITLQALGACSMTAVGALNIGSGASYTTIEGIYLDNNLIDRYNNGDDIQIKHCTLIQNSANGSANGRITVDARGSVFMTATQVNNGNKNTFITIDAEARKIKMGNAQAGGQPFVLTLENPGGALSMSYNAGADLAWSSSSGNVNFAGLNTVNCATINAGTVSATNGGFSGALTAGSINTAQIAGNTALGTVNITPITLVAETAPVPNEFTVLAYGISGEAGYVNGLARTSVPVKSLASTISNTRNITYNAGGIPYTQIDGLLTVAGETTFTQSVRGATITGTNIISPVNTYNYYVSPLGNDANNAGTLISPFATVAKAQLVASTIPDTTPVCIYLTAGNYTENIRITRHNTYLSGATTSQPSATVITGTLEFDMSPVLYPASIGSVVGVVLNKIIHTNTAPANSSVVVSDCIILPGAGQNAITTTDASVGGNADMTIQNSVVYMSDVLAVSISNTSISVINSQFTNSPFLANATTSFVNITGSGRFNMFSSAILQKSSSSTVQPLINFANTSVAQAMTFNNAILSYVSATSDAGTGAKCCMRFANSGAIVSVQLINSSLNAQGATTTNGIAGQILCVQRTGAGSVAFNYGNNLAGATANRFPNTGAGFTKTAYIVPS
jgi:hypothetical protein